MRNSENIAHIALNRVITNAYWHSIRISYCRLFHKVPNQEIDVMFQVSWVFGIDKCSLKPNNSM